MIWGEERFTSNGPCLSLLAGTLKVPQREIERLTREAPAEDRSQSPAVSIGYKSRKQRDRETVAPVVIEAPKHRSHAHLVLHGGEMKTFTQAGKDSGIKPKTIENRWRRGIRGDGLFEARFTPKNPARHGSNTMYRAHGCRCTACKAAAAVWRRRYNAIERSRIRALVK